MLLAPNFSGTWKAVLDKSDFGGAERPESLVMTVQHDDPELRFTVVAARASYGERKIEMAVTADGKEREFDEGKRKVTARWDGETLDILQRIQTPGGEVTSHDRFTLTADGLLMERTAKTPRGTQTARILHVRQ